MQVVSRRAFLRAAGGVIAGSVAKPLIFAQTSGKSPFKISVISDEISPDFDHACSVIAKEFGLSWVELRSMWGKSLMDLGGDQLQEAHQILSKYSLQVTDIASPL